MNEMMMTDKMTAIDTTNMCSHLQRKLFDANGEYHKIWLALQDDPCTPKGSRTPLNKNKCSEELTAVVRSRQLHIYRNGKHPEGELSTAESKLYKAKKVLVLAGKSAPKILRDDPICEMLAENL